MANHIDFTGHAVNETADASRGHLASFNPAALVQILSSPLVNRLLTTQAMKRLRDISFLGSIDYAPSSSKFPRYHRSRYTHSLGVAVLAMQAAERVELNEHDRDVAVAAAMLHDLGHGPLSHSLESDFECEFGVNHHRATEELLTGTRAESAEISTALKEQNVDALEVLALIEGKSPHVLNPLFSGPINLDTVEGILRSLKYYKNAPNTVTAAQVVDSVVRIIYGSPSSVDVAVADEFWNLKKLVYTQFVRGGIGIESDYKCHVYFSAKRHLFTANTFRWNEKKLRSAFPDLFSWMGGDEAPLHVPFEPTQPLPYTQRTFTIDVNAAEAHSGAGFINFRYRQSKHGALYDFAYKTDKAISQGMKCRRNRSLKSAVSIVNE